MKLEIASANSNHLRDDTPLVVHPIFGPIKLIK